MSRYSAKERGILPGCPCPAVRTILAAAVCVFTCLCTAISSGHTDDDWFRQGRRELRRAIRTTRWHNTNLAKNIILFVGDGMGVSTVTAARIRAGQLRGENGEENLLFFENFPHVGFMKTYSADAQVPDSAGTGTAIMTGIKVNSGVIGCDSRVKKGNCSAYGEDVKLKTILHAFIREGLSTGVVSNSRVTHATPASAFANSPHRGWEGDVDMAAAGEDCASVEDIAKQLVRNNKGIKVVLGGGRRYFLDNSTLDPETGIVDPSQRRDGINLIEEWKADKRLKNASHAYIWNKEQFQAVDPGTTDYLLGLFSPSHMDFEVTPPYQDDNQTEPSLVEMTDKAIRVLQKDTRGYFLMVEGARIDWGHHSNSAYTAMHETIAFDEAVQRAYQLTSRRDTLIIVTADHSHAFSIQGYAPRGHDILGLAEPASDHATLDNLPYTTLGYTNGPVFNRLDLTNVDTKSPSYRQPGCIPTSVETHAGEDVGAYAVGPMAHLLHSTHEQNYLYHLMEYAACVGRSKRYCLGSKDHIRY